MKTNTHKSAGVGAIKGEMTVRTVYGINGEFPVGTLHTSIGDFIIKDKLIEQLPAGKYKGTFLPESIFMHDYNLPGKKIVEHRMSLLRMELDDGSQYQPPSDEIDPASEELANTEDDMKTAGAEAIAVEEAKQANEVDTDTGNDADDVKTNSEVGAEKTAVADESGASKIGFTDEQIGLINARENLRLDTTLKRTALRAQNEFLKTLGYTFNFKEQYWHYLIT